MKEVKLIVSELRKFSEEIIDISPPLEDAQLIGKFESRFKVRLPEDYKLFLTEMNGVSLMGCEVYGLWDQPDTQDLFAVHNREHQLVAVPQFDHLVPFSPDGGGNFYCFDTHGIDDATGSCPVVFWVSNYRYNSDDLPAVTNHSFTDFVKQVIIDWTLEDYDYNGDEKI
jgi:hypothetical protein